MRLCRSSQLQELVVTDTVDAEDRGGEVTDVAEVVVDAREVSEDSNIVNSEEAVIQEIVISQDMYQVNIIVARKEIWKVGENVSVLKNEQRGMLKKSTSLINKSEPLSISPLKTIDETKIKEKVRQNKGTMSNIIRGDMTITEVNRVLLVGLYLVAQGLKKVGKQSQNKMKRKGKPYWQMQMEKTLWDGGKTWEKWKN